MRRTIKVHDSLQRYEYELSEPTGKNFDDAFRPDLTPQEMLSLGVFGGHYFEGEMDEYPESWFEGAKLNDTHDPAQNFFNVDVASSAPPLGIRLPQDVILFSWE